MIRVGSYTDTEFQAKKYKFENAINATQAALQEGIVAGGGIGLLNCKVDEPMFKSVLSVPFQQMAKNAGVKEDIELNTDSEGYDFKNKQVVDMFEAGIIDPYKVTRLALESATAIAISLVGTETVIVSVDEPKV